MTTLLIVLFVITYLAIALEHMLHINKSASALLGAGLLWTIYAVTATDPALVSEELGHTVAETAQIIFFLIGAMTIVEVVDAHNGFDVVTARVQTKSLAGLLCLIAFITFFLSAILDNLTTTIMMVSLVRKLLKEHEERLFFAGMIVIAANAGGAWSPIGDVTTTMLWIGGQITAIQIIKTLFIPSLVSLLIALAITGWLLRGRKVISPGGMYASDAKTTSLERNTMFFLGLGVLTAVPAFKTATHLPPFMGVLLGLGLVWSGWSATYCTKTRLPATNSISTWLAHCRGSIWRQSCFSSESCWRSQHCSTAMYWRRQPDGWTKPSAGLM